MRSSMGAAKPGFVEKKIAINATKQIESLFRFFIEKPPLRPLKTMTSPLPVKSTAENANVGATGRLPLQCSTHSLQSLNLRSCIFYDVQASLDSVCHIDQATRIDVEI